MPRRAFLWRQNTQSCLQGVWSALAKEIMLWGSFNRQCFSTSHLHFPFLLFNFLSPLTPSPGRRNFHSNLLTALIVGMAAGMAAPSLWPLSGEDWRRFRVGASQWTKPSGTAVFAVCQREKSGSPGANPLGFFKIICGGRGWTKKHVHSLRNVPINVFAVRLYPKCGEWLSLGRALEMPPPVSECLYKWQLCGQETWLLMQSLLKLTASKLGSFNSQQTLTWQFQSSAALLINESKGLTQNTSSSTDWCIFWFIVWNSLLENAYLMICLWSFKSCPGNGVTLFGPEQILTLKELHFKGMVYLLLLLPERWVSGSV